MTNDRKKFAYRCNKTSELCIMICVGESRANEASFGLRMLARLSSLDLRTKWSANYGKIDIVSIDARSHANYDLF